MIGIEDFLYWINEINVICIVKKNLLYNYKYVIVIYLLFLMDGIFN